MTRPQKLTLATLAVLILALLGYSAYLLLVPATNPSANALERGYEGQPTLGQADAPVKLILFENFLCEHCKALEAEVMPQLKRDYIDTGEVEAYYINLAWGGERATLAGLAGECAYSQNEDAFWRYKSALYEAQETWQGVDGLAKLAQNVDALDADALRTCIEEGRYQDEVQRDLDLAEQVGVEGTPSLVVGNQGFQGPSYSTLQREIETQLNAGGS